MENLNAFFKLRAYEQKKAIKQIALDLSLDNAYISRVFNNRIKLTKNRNFIKICKELKLDESTLMKVDTSFEALFSKYLLTVYYIDGTNRDNYYQAIIKKQDTLKNTPYYIHILLTKLIQAILFQYHNSEIDYIVKKLVFIKNSLEIKEKKLFLTFYLSYLANKGENKEFHNVLIEVLRIESLDNHLNMMAHYFYLIFKGASDPTFFLKSYYQCEKICINTNNTLRLFNLKMSYSKFLSSIGSYEAALQSNLQLLDEAYQIHYMLNIKILFNNIAWIYSLLKQYENAITYYLKAIVDYENNDTYFNLAWCYYNVGNNKKALLYIEKGSRSRNMLDFYYLLLEWLKAVINKKHSQKSIDLLLGILEKHDSSLTKVMKQFIYTQIVNAYEYRGQYKEALHFCKKISE